MYVKYLKKTEEILAQDHFLFDRQAFFFLSCSFSLGERLSIYIIGKN